MLIAAKILSLFLSVFIPIVMFAAEPIDPAYLAAASVEPAVQYVNDTTGTVFSFSVHNTGTTASIGAVAIERPSSSWTIVACPQAPAGWTAELADGKCRYVSAGATADDIQPGQKVSGFQLTAIVMGGDANYSGAWKVTVSKSNQFDNVSLLLSAASEQPGLIATARSWEVLDAVVASEPATPGSDCPAQSKQAISGSTVTLVICGRNRTSADLTPIVALSSLSGTFIAAPGAFSSDVISKETAGSVVLGNWTGVQVTSPSGQDKIVNAAIASATNRTSPSTTLTGYEAKNAPPTAANDSYSVNEDNVLAVSAPGVLTNDTGDVGGTLSAVLVSGTAHGTLAFNSNGSFDYTPNANYNGSDSFTYKANDASADSNIATVSLTIDPVNDAPAANDDAYSTAEDTTLSIVAAGVLQNDTDVEGSPLSAVLAAGPAHGALTLDANGSFSYTPNVNFNGSDSFTYTANDGDAGSNTATVHITVNPVSDTPVAANDSYATNEDVTLTVNTPGILGNDTDGDGDILTALRVSGPAHGALTLKANGSFTYTPAANYKGSDSFTYKASDGKANSNVATVSLTVKSINDAPVANDDAYSTAEDATLTVAAAGVLANDTDVESSPLTAVLVSGPAHGTLTLDANGSFSYTPSTNFSGSDSFTYKANDGAAKSNAASVNITVNPLNDAPVATDDSYAATEDVALTVDPPGVLGNDSDIDGDPLTAVQVTGPTHGTLALHADGSFDYTPDANYNGPDSFTYKANDASADSNAATVSLTIDAVNDAPVGNDDAYSTAEDATLTVVAAGVLANDTDVEGNPLTAVLVAGPAHGALTLDANGSFSYTPVADYFGSDSFTYTANDGDAGSNTATVHITVNPVNDAPVAADDSYATNEDVALTVDPPGLLANDTDADGDSLSALLVLAPAHGALLPQSDGSFIYMPAANYNGPDSFTYIVDDGTTLSSVATVSLTIDAVNDAPVANDDAYSTDEDTTLNVAAAGVLANDTDVENSPLTAVLAAGPAHGTLTLEANGSFSYTPAADYFGSDSFTYQANDGDAGSNTVTVTLAINAAPVADAQSVSTAEDTAKPITLSGSDTDDDPLTFTITAAPAHGTLGSTGTVDCSAANTCTAAVLYTPDANYAGPDSVSFKVSDGAIASADASVSITVNAVNDLPLAANDSHTTDEDTKLTVAGPGVLGNDSDIDGDALSAVQVSGPAHGTLALHANGSFDYTPNANYNGPDSFTYKANDASADSNTATVSLTINAVNDAPVANDDAYSTGEDTTLTVAAAGVLANDTDVENSPLTAVLAAGPAHGTLTLNANGSFSYTPSTNFSGSDSFTYKANDGDANSTVATANVSVNPINDAPVAADDSYAATEDVALTVDAPGLLSNDTDSDGDTLSVVLVTAPSHGVLTLPSDGSFTYVSDANYNGPDSFTYKANDASADSNTGTVSLTIDAVNDAPVGNDDAYSTAEDATLTVPAAGVLANDTDVEGSPLTAVLLAGPAHGTLTLDANGSFSYMPAADYFGSDGFTYRANDGDANSTFATAYISVNPINDAPVATDDSYATNEDVALTVDPPGVLGNDPDIDGDMLTAVQVTGPAHGTLALHANGSFDYTPNANYNGPDSFTYIVDDGTTLSSVATVSLTIDAVNDAPVANDDAYSTDEDTTLNIAAAGVLANDTDVENSPLTAVLAAGPAHGTLTLEADGSFSYMPAADYFGSDSFTYQANDGDAGSNTATVTLAINAAPMADAQSVSTAEDTAKPITLSGSDADDDPLTFTITAAPAHGTLGSTGTVDCSAANTCTAAVLYTPDANYAGPDSVSFKVSDGAIASADASVSITVNAVNDLPLAANDSYTTDEDTKLTVAGPGVLGNDSDIDGDALSAVQVSGPAHGTLALHANGSFDYTPNANYNGPDSFTYKANDASADSNTATVSLTINAVNDAPVNAVPDAQTVDEDTELVFSTANGNALSVADVDVASGNIQITVSAANGTLTPATGSGASVSGSGTSSASVTGTPSQVNAALNGLKYQGAANWNSTRGPETLTITTNDQGNAGQGGTLSDTDTVGITVNAVNDPPTAEAKSFSAQTNMKINGLTGLLAGASDPDAGDGSYTAALTVGTVSATTPAGGAISNLGASTGTFDFDPPTGATGNVTFTYTVCDSGNPTPAACSAPATVTVNVTGPIIWFVNPAAVTNGDGRLSSPFNSLAPFSPVPPAPDVDASGHRIFVYSGTASGSLTLNANEWLVGQGVTGFASFDALMGITPPTGTIARATLGTGVATLQGTVTLAANTVIKAIAISNSGASQGLVGSGGISGVDVTQTSISTATGTALSLNNVGGALSLTAVAANGAATAIDLTNVSAPVTIGSGAIQNTTTAGVSLNGGTGNFSETFSALTNSSGRTILVQNRTGGTVSFSGTINGGGTGILLDKNTGSTIDFSAGLTMNLSTGTSDAFTATGGGTVSVAGTNTLTTGTGTALKVTNTTIGATGLTFRSISANGGANGILLSNTGSSGGLTVTGTGGLCTEGNPGGCTGGVIQNMTGGDDSSATPAGAGIVLNNAASVSLTRMYLHDHSNYGIRGTIVNGFVLDNSVLNGTNGTDAPASAGSPYNEGTIKFDNLSGSATISSSAIRGGISNNVRVDNTSATLNRITFSGDTIGCNSTNNGEDGILLESENTGVVLATVQNTTFTCARGDLFNFVDNASSGATDDLIFANNTLSNNHPAIATGGGGTTISSNGTKNFTFSMTGNSFRNAVGHAVLLVKSTGPASYSGTFANNTIGDAGTWNSGSLEGDALKVQSAGGGTLTISITGNQIRQYNNFGVELLTGGSATRESGNFNATVTGNTISNPGNNPNVAIPMNGIQLNGGTVPGDTYSICTQIGGPGAPANTINGSGANGGMDVRLRQRQSTTVRLPGYGGANNDNTAVQNFLIANNAVNPSALTSNTVGSGGGGFGGGAACSQP